MSLLTRAERRELIDLLLQLPNINDPHTRRQILSGLPTTILHQIGFSNAARIDIIAIIDTIDADGMQLSNNTWPITTVIENAIDGVVGTRLADDLKRLLDKLQSRSSAFTAPRNTSLNMQSQEPHSPTSSASAHPTQQPVLQLDRTQQQHLQQALLSAFENLQTLQQMVYYGLSQNLDEISSSQNRAHAIFDLIRWADAQGRTQELVLAARERVPGNPALRTFADQHLLTPPIIAPPTLQPGIEILIQEVELEKVVNNAANFSDVDTWMARMSEIVSTVCRVETPTDLGTGFLVGPNLVMTNYHVVKNILDSPAWLSQVVLRFDYRTDVSGMPIREGKTYRLASDQQILSSAFEDLDYILLTTEGNPGNEPIGGQVGAPNRKWLTPVTRSLTPGQPLFVIQHPEGKSLKIAFDIITDVTPNRIRYRTNTKGGSSGSPCFNDNWELVALHHASDSRTPALFNQGIPFSAILGRSEIRAALGL